MASRESIAVVLVLSAVAVAFTAFVLSMTTQYLQLVDLVLG